MKTARQRPTTRRRGLLTLAGLTSLLAAAVGHVFFWYVPRPRPSAPDPASACVQLIGGSEYPVGLWIPFPHQNLGVLAELASGDPQYLEALRRLAGLPETPLPAFGPFPVPPARDLAVVSDESGENFALAARIYPAMAVLAKLGGRLAANPWLAGGEVYLDGRAAQVEWRGSTWWVTSGLAPAPAQSQQSVDLDQAAWAWIEMRQPAAPLPAGSYLLTGSAAEGFDLATHDPVAPPGRLQQAGFGGDELFLLALAGRENHLAEPAGALMLFELDDDSHDLPRSAVLSEPGSDRWQIPGESILELGGRHLYQGQAAGWQIDAIDRFALEGGQDLAAGLVPLTERGGLAWGLWLDIDRGGDEVRRIAGMMRENPLVPARTTRRWQDVETLLEPLGRRFSTFVAEVSGSPRSARLSLRAARSTESTAPADD